jgi:hypothetical protein
VEAETIQGTDPARAEARLPRWMLGIAAAGTVATFIAAPARFAGGFAVGAALAILGYLWLHEAVDKLLAAAPERLPWGTIVRFALRYPLALGAVYAFYRTGWLAHQAVLAGLFVPVAGAFVEAVVQIRENWRCEATGPK